MVSLVRQPDNQYDPNAVKVTDVMGGQVGHIKKELAKSLAVIMDNKLARIDGYANGYLYLFSPINKSTFTCFLLI